MKLDKKTVKSWFSHAKRIKASHILIVSYDGVLELVCVPKSDDLTKYIESNSLDGFKVIKVIEMKH